MADLFTHYAAARFAASPLRSRDAALWIVLGTFLPDLVSKGLYWITRASSDFDDPAHSILGIAILAYLVALFTRPPQRPAVFLAVWAGGLLHALVDLLKDNLGTGGARLFLPFSLWGPELGWIDPENVILLLPADLVLVGAAILIERRRRPA
jgi:hypothetical protein